MNLSSSFRDGPKGRTRNPYSAALGLWIPGSLAEPVIGPRFARTRWLAPRNDGKRKRGAA